MKKLRRTVTVALGGFIVLHLLGFAIARPATRMTYRALERIGVDDELPALAIPISTALFWPFEKRAVRELLEATLEESTKANDLRAFAVASALARRLRPGEAEEVFVDSARRLQSGSCEGKFLVASLLPLAARAGLLSREAVVKTIWDAYDQLGYRGATQEDRCHIFTKALDACLSGTRPIGFRAPGATQSS